MYLRLVCKLARILRRRRTGWGRRDSRRRQTPRSDRCCSRSKPLGSPRDTDRDPRRTGTRLIEDRKFKTNADISVNHCYLSSGSRKVI